MTFDELRNELCAIRSGEVLSPAEESFIPILLELVDSVESVHRRVQEIALANGQATSATGDNN